MNISIYFENEYTVLKDIKPFPTDVTLSYS